MCCSCMCNSCFLDSHRLPHKMLDGHPLAANRPARQSFKATSNATQTTALNARMYDSLGDLSSLVWTIIPKGAGQLWGKIKEDDKNYALNFQVVRKEICFLMLCNSSFLSFQSQKKDCSELSIPGLPFEQHLLITCTRSVPLDLKRVSPCFTERLMSCMCLSQETRFV